MTSGLTNDDHIYRVGIVGLSWITSEPARPGTHPVLGSAPPHSHLAALATMSEVQVVAGCDISDKACNRFTETWSRMWPGLRTYDDYREMIDSEHLDIICVATPDHLHGDVVRYASENGVRGIFCEKPLSVSVTDVDSIIASVEKHNVVMNVNNTRRWVPTYVAAREKVRGGAIGTLIQVNVHFGGERAMLWRNHSHFLDIISFFAESDPKWVLGELEAQQSEYGLEYQGDGGRSPDREPGLNAYIVYQNEVRGFLSGLKSGVAELSIQLIGSEGRIDMNDKQATLIRNSTQTPIIAEWTMQSFQAALVNLISSMEAGTEPACPPREARKTVAIIEGILESQHQGNVRVDVSGSLHSHMNKL